MMQTDLGSFVTPKLAIIPVQVTASGTDPELSVNGPTVDRLGYRTGILTCPVAATLAATNTFTVSAKVQHSDTGTSGWADFAGPTNNLVLTGAADGSTESGLLELNLNLTTAKRYIRAVITGTLSAAETDTARAAGAFILSGAAEKPV